MRHGWHVGSLFRRCLRYAAGVPHGSVIGRPILVVCSVASERVWPVADARDPGLTRAVFGDAGCTGCDTAGCLLNVLFRVFSLSRGFIGEFVRVCFRVMFDVSV